jgi:hypothetical protein
MKPADFDRFSDILQGVLEVYGKERSPTAIALWFKVLGRYDLSRVEPALAEHVAGSKFAPTPHDIIAIMSSSDGRPTGDEAWAMIPRDEQSSVIWTDEMSKAYGVASALLEHGDPVAARRAFIDRYEHEVAANRKAGIPVKAWPSWGWDEAGRAPALAKAVEMGMLAPQAAAQYALQLAERGDIHPSVTALLDGVKAKQLQ